MTGTAEKLILFFTGYLASGKGTDKLFDVKEHREKRSLSQNAYYWQLLSKLARKLHVSNARVHNMLLRDVAPPFEIGGQVAMQPIPDTDEAEQQVLEAETYHLRPTSGIIETKDGKRCRWYVVLRGSSTFNTEEMSALLDKLIEECNQPGIETLSPAELEMIREHEREHERRMAKNTRKQRQLETNA